LLLLNALSASISGINQYQIGGFVNDGQFLWGLFRKKKIDKTIERVPKMESADQLGAVTPKLEFYNNLEFPPGFE